ncbi:hypothetical protein MRX96_016965 [Rhipicephalus microplus]
MLRNSEKVTAAGDHAASVSRDSAKKNRAHPPSTPYRRPTAVSACDAVCANEVRLIQLPFMSGHAAHVSVIRMRKQRQQQGQPTLQGGVHGAEYARVEGGEIESSEL